ncbi:MAG: chromosome segregation protein SMC [Xenococcaceae cyanobacterium]
MENQPNNLSSLSKENLTYQEVLKLARLRILLIKIEQELNTVQTSLTNIKNSQQQTNPDSALLPQIDVKLYLIEQLLYKIRKVRLNLNYYFS